MKYLTALTIQEKYSKMTLLEKEYAQDPLPLKLNFMIKRYKDAGIIVKLVQTNGKCENCGSEEITVHHLITRDKKYGMDIKDYRIQRHHHSNIKILCILHHHVEIHKIPNIEHTHCLNKKTVQQIIHKAKS